MIRRFYVLPLERAVPEAKIEEMVAALTAADHLIPGLDDSFAAIDQDSRTVVWEMTFRDEETYTGSYMVHPFHAATIDNYLLGDSPERITHDFAAMRYRVPEGAPRPARGIRRILLMNIADGADLQALEELAVRGDHMLTSVLAPDDIGWLSSKGRGGLTWTHIWEQAFADLEALDHYLASPDGVAGSDRDGLRRLGVDVRSLKVLTYPFALEPAPAGPVTLDDRPFLYTITARVANDDVETYLGLLEQEYDVVLARAGATLQSRWRTLEGGYLDVEVHSTWQLSSLAAFKELRTVMLDDPSWIRFVLRAMPLVHGGTRRFYRPA
ncbi:MAG: hypothetical protein ABWZ30_00135 [Jiangellaceae bacterium]